MKAAKSALPARSRITRLTQSIADAARWASEKARDANTDGIRGADLLQVAQSKRDPGQSEYAYGMLQDAMEAAQEALVHAKTAHDECAALVKVVRELYDEATKKPGR